MFGAKATAGISKPSAGRRQAPSAEARCGRLDPAMRDKSNVVGGARSVHARRSQATAVNLAQRARAAEPRGRKTGSDTVGRGRSSHREVSSRVPRRGQSYPSRKAPSPPKQAISGGTGRSRSTKTTTVIPKDEAPTGPVGDGREATEAIASTDAHPGERRVPELTVADRVVTEYERLLEAMPTLAKHMGRVQAETEAMAMGLEKRVQDLVSGYRELGDLAEQAPLHVMQTASDYANALGCSPVPAPVPVPVGGGNSPGVDEEFNVEAIHREIFALRETKIALDKSVAPLPGYETREEDQIAGRANAQGADGKGQASAPASSGSRLHSATLARSPAETVAGRQRGRGGGIDRGKVARGRRRPGVSSAVTRRALVELQVDPDRPLPLPAFPGVSTMPLQAEGRNTATMKHHGATDGAAREGRHRYPVPGAVTPKQRQSHGLPQELRAIATIPTPEGRSGVNERRRARRPRPDGLSAAGGGIRPPAPPIRVPGGSGKSPPPRPLPGSVEAAALAREQRRHAIKAVEELKKEMRDRESRLMRELERLRRERTKRSAEGGSPPNPIRESASKAAVVPVVAAATGASGRRSPPCGQQRYDPTSVYLAPASVGGRDRDRRAKSVNTKGTQRKAGANTTIERKTKGGGGGGPAEADRAEDGAKVREPLPSPAEAVDARVQTASDDAGGVEGGGKVQEPLPLPPAAPAKAADAFMQTDGVRLYLNPVSGSGAELVSSSSTKGDGRGTNRDVTPAGVGTCTRLDNVAEQPGLVLSSPLSSVGGGLERVLDAQLVMPPPPVVFVEGDGRNAAWRPCDDDDLLRQQERAGTGREPGARFSEAPVRTVLAQRSAVIDDSESRGPGEREPSTALPVDVERAVDQPIRLTTGRLYEDPSSCVDDGERWVEGDNLLPLVASEGRNGVGVEAPAPATPAVKERELTAPETTTVSSLILPPELIELLREVVGQRRSVEEERSALMQTLRAEVEARRDLLADQASSSIREREVTSLSPGERPPEVGDLAMQPSTADAGARPSEILPDGQDGDERSSRETSEEVEVSGSSECEVGGSAGGELGELAGEVVDDPGGRDGGVGDMHGSETRIDSNGSQAGVQGKKPGVPAPAKAEAVQGTYHEFRSNLGRMLAGGESWSKLPLAEAPAPRRTFSTSLGEVLAGGLIGKELPPARGFLPERTETPRDHLADGRVALGDSDEDVQGILWGAPGGAGDGDGGEATSPIHDGASRQAAALESRRFFGSKNKSEKQKHWLQSCRGAESSLDSQGCGLDANIPVEGVDSCVQTEEPGIDLHHPRVLRAADASTAVGRGRLELSLATAVLSMTQRMTQMESEAWARAQNAETAAKEALEESKRQAVTSRERQSEVMLRLEQMEKGSHERAAVVTTEVARLREEARLAKEGVLSQQVRSPSSPCLSPSTGTSSWVGSSGSRGDGDTDRSERRNDSILGGVYPTSTIGSEDNTGAPLPPPSASRSSFSEGQLLGASVSDGELVRLSPRGRHVLEEGEIPRRPRGAGAVFAHGESPPNRSCSDPMAESKSHVLECGDESDPNLREQSCKLVSAHSALGVKRVSGSGHRAIDLESTWQRSIAEAGCGEATAKWLEGYNSLGLNWHRRRSGRGARSSTDGSYVEIGDSIESGECIGGVSPGEVSPSSTGSLFSVGRRKAWGDRRCRGRGGVGVDRHDCSTRDGLRGRLDGHHELRGVYTELQGIGSTSTGGDAGDEKTLEQTGGGDSSGHGGDGIDRRECLAREGLGGRPGAPHGLPGLYAGLQGIGSTSSGVDAGDEKTLEQTGGGDSSAVSRLSLEGRRGRVPTRELRDGVYSAVVTEGAMGSSSASGGRGQASSRCSVSTGEYRPNREGYEHADMGGRMEGRRLCWSSGYQESVGDSPEFSAPADDSSMDRSTHKTCVRSQTDPSRSL